MMDYRCADCAHFCRPEAGEIGRCTRLDSPAWSGDRACADMCRIARCAFCGEILPKGKRRFCGESCREKMRKKNPGRTKPKSGRASAGFGIEEITRIAAAIADETGHMPSYGKLVADIDAGRITNPAELLRKGRRRYDG